MGLADILKRLRRTLPTPPTPPKPITPPPAPAIDPEVVKRRQEALTRHSNDVYRYKQYVTQALATGFLPPAPPSPTYYDNNPSYVWSPTETNPERPAPAPKPQQGFTIFVNDVQITTIVLPKDVTSNVVFNAAQQNVLVKPWIKGKAITNYGFGSDGEFKITTSNLPEAQNRRTKDLNRYRVESRVKLGVTYSVEKRVPQVPSLKYYLDNPDYVWDPKAPAVQEQPKPQPIEPTKPDVPKPVEPEPQDPPEIKPPVRPI